MIQRALGIFALLLCSCGNNPNTLGGSIGDTHDLTFNTVSIVAQQGAINIIYNGANAGVVAELSVQTVNVAITNGTTLNGNTFTQNVTLTRAVANPNDVFPQVVGGTLTFNQYSATAGGVTAGSFGVDFLGGALLTGKFSGNTTVQQ